MHSLDPLTGCRAVRICCLLATGWAFWNYEIEDVDHFGNSLVEVASRQGGDGARRSSKGSSGIARALKNRTTLVGALFVFAYQGIEVAESGWFISCVAGHLHTVEDVTSADHIHQIPDCLSPRESEERRLRWVITRLYNAIDRLADIR